MANVTTEACIKPSRATTSADGTVVCEQRAFSNGRMRTVYSQRVSITDSIDRFWQYVGENLEQEADTEFAYFKPDYDASGVRTGKGKCVKWKPTETIEQGCAPFASEAECSFTCREYDSNKMAEVTEELEHEAVEIGSFLFHFAIMFYMCLALALVCEDFFVAALEIIIDKLKLPPDVAGATFMAAGSSSPELFVATVAVFAVGDAGHRCSLLNDDNRHFSPGSPDFQPEFAMPCDTPFDSLGWLTDPDAMGRDGVGNTTGEACALVDAHIPGQQIYIDEGVGVGAVVGSTMFNTLVIIGGSAIVSGKISKLDWRIIMRDGTTYMVSIIALAWILNMPTMEPPVLAFFTPGSDTCKPMKLTKQVIDSITADHQLSGHAAFKLSPDTTYCGTHTVRILLARPKRLQPATIA